MARPEKQQSGKQQNKSKCQNVKTKQSIDELNAIQTTPLCCECGAIDRRISYLLSVKLIFVSETELALWSKTFFFLVALETHFGVIKSLLSSLLSTCN